jgi:8-oxo-dGTP diphosphatase
MTRRDASRSSAPVGYDPTAFPQFAVTVDIVVLAMQGADLEVMLIRRGVDPYREMWALPGGFKRPDESLDAAAQRELREEAGISHAVLEQFHAFGDPGRDARLDVVTVGYVATLPVMPPGFAGGDASDAQSMPVASVRAGTVDLAFDHALILSSALANVADRMATTNLALSLVPREFTIRQLRLVFEAAWDTTLGSANFHRSLLAGDWIVPTNQFAPPGAGGGRPAELFTAGKDWKHGSPIRRPKSNRRSR